MKFTCIHIGFPYTLPSSKTKLRSSEGMYNDTVSFAGFRGIALERGGVWSSSVVLLYWSWLCCRSHQKLTAWAVILPELLGCGAEVRLTQLIPSTTERLQCKSILNCPVDSFGDFFLCCLATYGEGSAKDSAETSSLLVFSLSTHLFFCQGTAWFIQNKNIPGTLSEAFYWRIVTFISPSLSQGCREDTCSGELLLILEQECPINY